MSSATLFRWSNPGLVDIDDTAATKVTVEAADSLLVSEGRAFALDLHRARFHDAVRHNSKGSSRFTTEEVDAFWTAAFAAIPVQGSWFPRVELHSREADVHLAFRLRPAPELTRSVTLHTHVGKDPRSVPAVKGPDLETLGEIRRDAHQHGVDDVVFTSPEGFIIDGAANAIVWWRGDTLCAPPSESDDSAFARVHSVTGASLLGLAAALGVETRAERMMPSELDGCEVWALNALHGIRMVTAWVGVPQLAEKPGRIGVWRDRRNALRTPTGDLAT